MICHTLLFDHIRNDKCTITRFRIRTDKRRTSRLIYKRDRGLIAQVDSHRTLSDYDFHTVISKALGLILLKLIYTSLGENKENEQLTRFENLTLQTVPSLSFYKNCCIIEHPDLVKVFGLFLLFCVIPATVKSFRKWPLIIRKGSMPRYLLSF